MGAEAGDVYIVPFFRHQEDRRDGEARWIIFLEGYGKTISVVPMTKQIHQADNYQKVIEVLKDSAEGRMMGLPYDSIIICDREEEMSHFVIGKWKKKGQCSEEMLDRIFKLLN